ncbi:YdcF family protein [Cyanothece sp. BG0011]|uniref:YdcF family protein n=1 Tax=Cyanothece sp. BG0011 TaxID=2082950 RepID=UPI000D1E9B98|nr:YdcF family protein [Cyanothece sp. BG0011]
MSKSKLDLTGRLKKKKWKKRFKLFFILLIGFILSSLVFNVFIRLPINTNHSVDGILVLGGSIRREIYAAQIASQYEYQEVPLIVSQGSKPPCIKLIFQREQARMDKVWIEQCAYSTFDNFFFSVPLLQKHGVHKVKVITSQSHLPRAKWLSYIHLGAKGIAVEVDTPKEKGVPGNHESDLKTFLDVTRSLMWAGVSQIIQPPCFEVTPLEAVNLTEWYEKGFNCEYQGGLSRVGSQNPRRTVGDGVAHSGLSEQF